MLIINGVEHSTMLVTYKGITEFRSENPETKRNAKIQYMEILHIGSAEVFSDEKTLLFVQTINGK